MKRLAVLTLFLLFITSNAYAVENKVPGEPMPANTPADIETKPERYYPPQKAQPDPGDDPYNNPNEVNPEEHGANPN
ncbi:MAG: hypothetical protein Q8R83_03380 [Legionellaceae bacterium]|nr:hypothetical protein [Legionellaceae bacterium]